MRIGRVQPVLSLLGFEISLVFGMNGVNHFLIAENRLVLPPYLSRICDIILNTSNTRKQLIYRGYSVMIDSR
jgi:hypothetical protein